MNFTQNMKQVTHNLKQKVHTEDSVLHSSYFIRHTSFSGGFTILFAVLIGALLFSMGLALAHITLKEVLLSAAGKQSDAAFFLADTGAECALYFDLRIGNTFPNSSTAQRDSDGVIRCNNTSIPLTFLPASSGAAATSFRLLVGSACADVLVTKTTEPKTVIESRGRNDCGTGINPSRVERALRVRY